MTKRSTKQWHRATTTVLQKTLLLMLLHCLALPSQAADNLLIVLNKSDHNAALVDPVSLEVIAKLPTGRGPHEAIASPDGHYAYVANYGAWTNSGKNPAGEKRWDPGHTITVLDLKKRVVKTTFDLKEYSDPHGVALSQDGTRLWVTAEGAQAVVEINTATGVIEKAWQTQQRASHMLVPTPDERKLYVANIGSGSVTVIDRRDDSVQSIPTGAGTEGIDVTPDGHAVWVTNRQADTVSVLDVATDRVVATFDSGGEFPIRVKFTPDGKQAWVSNASSNNITIFDVATRTQTHTITVQEAPIGLLLTPDGRRAFVANTSAHQVTVIDVYTHKVLEHFTTGTEPDGMAWAD